MQVPRDDLPPLRHELQLIREEQGVEACKTALEAPDAGERLRKHVATCKICKAIVDKIYPDGVIPVEDDDS